MVPSTPTIARRAISLCTVVALAGLGSIGFALAASHTDLPKNAALKVDGTIVSVDTLTSRMKALQALYGIAAPKTAKERDSFRRDTAKSLAVEQMLEKAARDKKIVIADKAINDALAELIAQRYSNGGRQAFVKALGDLGASEAQVKAEIRQQMLVAQLFDNVTGAVEVSDADLKTAFADRRTSLGTPEKRTIRNIVVQSESDANKVIVALDAGVPFAAAAQRSSLDGATRSKGGLLGSVQASDLEPAYAKVAFAAEPKKPFGPVKTQYGWNVGVVDSVTAPVPAVYAEVKATLKATLEKEQSLKLWSAWLKRLVAGGGVVYANDYRPADPNSIPALSGTDSAN
jgi:peptidyl-prolyl cis-trans isomerase C